MICGVIGLAKILELMENQLLKCKIINWYSTKKTHAKSDEKMCMQYNKIFDSTYVWIKKSVENKNNSKQYFKSELDRERRKGFAKILSLAKPLGMYVSLGEKDLYKNKLGYYMVIKDNHILISGDRDKIIEYLKEMKKESK